MRHKLSRIGIYTTLITAAFFCLFPMYILVATALKSLPEIYSMPSWALPSHIDLSGFAAAWNGLSGGFVNSFEFTIPAVAISVFLGSLGGFALTKVRFKGADAVFLFLLFGMFLPYQIVLLPLVKFMAMIHLYGNISSLILTHVAYGIPITTLIFRNFYSSVPTSLVEAGKVDGASIWQIYLRVILPVSVPGAVVAVIWQFTHVWNDFLFGLVLGSTPSVTPVTVLLNNLKGSMISQWNTLMAGALLTALPTIVVYLFMGKYFVKGLLGGSVKG